jgi:predicted GNAT family acetyltransferase
MKQIIPSTSLPNGLRGIYALNPIGDHRVRALAHQAANQIATDFPDAAGVAPHMAGTDDRALFIENEDGEIVALLVWLMWDAGSGWIGTVWTHPDYRKLGLYARMYEALKSEAKEENMTLLGCGVEMANTISRSVHEALGMIASSITYCEAI